MGGYPFLPDECLSLQQVDNANWLPAPNDLIYLAMRLYWPRTTPPSILPVGEGTWQPPAIVKVN